jgi:hypothetical protein
VQNTEVIMNLHRRRNFVWSSLVQVGHIIGATGDPEVWIEAGE